jgi:hypothetical protein
MKISNLNFTLALEVDWTRVARTVELVLEVVAVLWVLTSFSFEPVVPVYQWY